MTIPPPNEPRQDSLELLALEDGWGDFLNQNPEAKRNLSHLGSLISFLREEPDKNNDNSTERLAEQLSAMTKEEIAPYWELYEAIKNPKIRRERPREPISEEKKREETAQSTLLFQALMIGAAWREWRQEDIGSKKTAALQLMAQTVWNENLLMIDYYKPPVGASPGTTLYALVNQKKEQPKKYKPIPSPGENWVSHHIKGNNVLLVHTYDPSKTDGVGSACFAITPQYDSLTAEIRSKSLRKPPGSREILDRAVIAEIEYTTRPASEFIPVVIILEKRLDGNQSQLASQIKWKEYKGR